MAVNGVEIKVGQKWLTRGDAIAVVMGRRENHAWPWVGECAGLKSWTNEGVCGIDFADISPDDLIELIEDTSQAQPLQVDNTVASGGGKLTGNHYYRVQVGSPISAEVQPYVAECADIIEALNMTFNEGEAFKAIWRLAAARQGRGKAGNKPEYDADKAAHYGERIAAQTRKGGGQ